MTADESIITNHVTHDDDSLLCSHINNNFLLFSKNLDANARNDQQNRDLQNILN
jgi:hypothetical protein